MNIKYYLMFIVFAINIYSYNCLPAPDSVFMKSATKESRESFRTELTDYIVHDNLTAPLKYDNISQYKRAFWGAELGLINDSIVKFSLKKILASYILHSFDEAFYRSAVQTAHTLFRYELEPEIVQIMTLTENPKLFAMCVSYLMQIQKAVEMHRNYYKTEMARKFPNWESEPILFMLNYYITTKPTEQFIARPALQDLLAKNYGAQNTVIFSIQRHQRDYPGLVIIKKPDGKFVRLSPDSIFCVPQLARSITNLPGYITNGNTPQGILSIQGIDTSKNVFIGPTPNIQLILPFEDSTKSFFQTINIVKNDSAQYYYKKLLPESWQNYTPIWEAFYAGKAGRSEIISHGTTIDPFFYKDKPYYPQTPSMGCLCCNEVWDDNGYRSKSDQQELMNAFLSTGNTNGFLIVVELDNKQKPVTFNEIKNIIFSVETGR